MSLKLPLCSVKFLTRKVQYFFNQYEAKMQIQSTMTNNSKKTHGKILLKPTWQKEILTHLSMTDGSKRSKNQEHHHVEINKSKLKTILLAKNKGLRYTFLLTLPPSPPAPPKYRKDLENLIIYEAIAILKIFKRKYHKDCILWPIQIRLEISED